MFNTEDTFSAEDAQRSVAEYYKRGEELSSEWLSENTNKVLNSIKNASKSGKTEISHDFELHDDKYALAKMKCMLHSFMRLKFKVSVSEKITMNGPMKKTLTVFTVSWG
jgi:hypothetical protein